MVVIPLVIKILGIIIVGLAAAVGLGKLDAGSAGDLATDAANQAQKFPLSDLWDMIMSGTLGIVKWFAQTVSILLTDLVRLIPGVSKDFLLPDFIGWIIIAFIMSRLIYGGISKIWEISLSARNFTLIVGILIVVVFAFLTFMKII